MKLRDSSIGVIGCGNLGGALVRGLSALTTQRPKKLIVFDTDPSRAESCSGKVAVIARNVSDVVEQSVVIIIAVKPQDITSVLSAVRASAKGSQLRCVISVAAGVPTSTLVEHLGGDLAIVRVMPNLPSVIGQGMSGIFAPLERQESSSYLELAQELFSAIGETVVLKRESDINTVTSLSAGGPAYTALFIEALADGGVKMGLTREQALKLSIQTVLGTAEMLKKQEMHPAELRENVASAGGTTIHGLHALEKGAVRASVIAAVEAGTRRAEEMQQRPDQKPEKAKRSK